MLFDAHARAFALFGGVPSRCIYDNIKTAVTTVFTGKERPFNRRFLIMTDHYIIEPTACSPAAGCEKGQVEHQVQTIRERFFQPRLRFAKPWEQGDLNLAQALDAMRPRLQPTLAPFDDFHDSEHSVTGTCLVSFDRTK